MSAAYGSLRSVALASFALASFALACTTVEGSPSAVPPAPDTVDADSQPDAGSGVDAAPPYKVSFPHAESRGGPVIKAGKVVPIVFKDDALASSIDSFGKKLGGSAYWSGTATEYGVGAITAGEMIELTETPPTETTWEEIEAWLKGKFAGETPELGAPDPNTLYALYYPKGTSIEATEALGKSCVGHFGYHYAITVGDTEVGYAVIPRCAGIDQVTVAASHEYFEWATNPFPLTRPAFRGIDDEHWVWQHVTDIELSDLCTTIDRSLLRPPELGFQVQRQWSNKLSLAGAFPCAPVKDVPNVQAVIAAEDDTVVPDYTNPGKNVTTKAVRVEPGQTQTVNVHIYSDQPYAKDVPLRVVSLEEFRGTSSTTGFTFALSAEQARVGSTVTLDVSAKKKGSDVAIALAYLSKTEVHMWPVLVTTLSSLEAKSAVADLATMFRSLSSGQIALPPPPETAGRSARR